MIERKEGDVVRAMKAVAVIDKEQHAGKEHDGGRMPVAQKAAARSKGSLAVDVVTTGSSITTTARFKL